MPTTTNVAQVKLNVMTKQQYDAATKVATELYAVTDAYVDAVNNNNTATGAINPIYDWVGTMSEYETQNVATLHPDWICYITDDIGGPATVIAELAEGLNDKVDVGHEVIAFQEPAAANNYTWYRKYADGWVEQGGYKTNSATSVSITLPITMSDTNYVAIGQVVGANTTNTGTKVTKNSTTQITVYIPAANDIMWVVSGIVA